MSSLLALQTADTIIFASDTALSAKYNDKSYRVDNNETKLFDYPRFIMFASGKKVLRDRLIDSIGSNPTIDKIKKVLQEEIELDSTEFSLEVVIALKNMSKIIFFSSTDHFKYRDSKPSKDNTEIFTAGYKTNEIADTFIDNFNKYPVLQSIENTYKNYVCDEIGGNVDIIIMQKNSLRKEKIKLDNMKEFSDEEILNDLNLVHAERLVGRLILGNKLIISDENGTFTINGNLLTIKDADGKVRVRLGEYTKGKYGLQLFSKGGNQVVLDEDGMLQTWQEGRTDNVDQNHPLELYIYIPKETISIKKVLLRFKLLEFRAYSQTTEGGGGMYSTTSAGGGSFGSTSSGGGTYSTTGAGGGTITTTGSSGIDVIYGLSQTEPAAGHSHLFRDVIGHKHPIDLPAHDHSFTVNAHTHNVTINAHSHDFNVPAHSHAIQHGIYKGSQARNLSIAINGTIRDYELGGKFNSDRDNIDIAPYLIKGYGNKIELFSSQLGRIDATAFVQALVGYE